MNELELRAQAAAQLGYRVVKASEVEVGLVKGERGIRTWFNEVFDGVFPSLKHPIILRTIQVEEERAHWELVASGNPDNWIHTEYPRFLLGDVLLRELRIWLDGQVINPNTIGDIRRACFMPWECTWNGIVLEETAQRERNCP